MKNTKNWVLEIEKRENCSRMSLLPHFLPFHVNPKRTTTTFHRRRHRQPPPPPPLLMDKTPTGDTSRTIKFVYKKKIIQVSTLIASLFPIFIFSIDETGICITNQFKSI